MVWRPSFPSCSDFTGASTLTILRSELGVKSFLEAAPPIEDCRPDRCPCCNLGARPLGAALRLVGHGVRRRGLVWRTGLGHQIRRVVLWVRRYLCRACGHTMTVLPCEVAPRRRYDLGLIVFCLAVWSGESMSAAAVRRIVCPDSCELDWPQLRRWVRALSSGCDPPKVTARRVVQQAAGRAPPHTRETHTLAQRAVEGAASMM